MSAAQTACRIAARAMVEELKTARAIGMEWREAMDSANAALDDILEMAGLSSAMMKGDGK